MPPPRMIAAPSELLAARVGGRGGHTRAAGGAPGEAIGDAKGRVLPGGVAPMRWGGGRGFVSVGPKTLLNSLNSGAHAAWVGGVKVQVARLTATGFPLIRGIFSWRVEIAGAWPMHLIDVERSA